MYYNVGSQYSPKWFNDNLRVMKKRRRFLERKIKEKTNAVWFKLSQYKKNYKETLHWNRK